MNAPICSTNGATCYTTDYGLIGGSEGSTGATGGCLTDPGGLLNRSLPSHMRTSALRANIAPRARRRAAAAAEVGA